MNRGGLGERGPALAQLRCYPNFNLSFLARKDAAVVMDCRAPSRGFDGRDLQGRVPRVFNDKLMQDILAGRD